MGLRREVSVQLFFELVTLPVTLLAVGAGTALASRWQSVRPADWWLVALVTAALAPVVFTVLDRSRPSGRSTRPFPALGGDRWTVLAVVSKTFVAGGLFVVDLGALRLGLALGAGVGLSYAVVVRAWIALARRWSRLDL